MGPVIVKGGVKEIKISAVITRADGTVEDLGVIHKTRAAVPGQQRIRKVRDNGIPSN